MVAVAAIQAPMVSICGGEPLIYPKIEELVAGLLEQGRIVYVCTNDPVQLRAAIERAHASGIPVVVEAEDDATRRRALELRAATNTGRMIMPVW